MAVQASGNAIGNAIGGSLGSFVVQQTTSEVTKLGGAKRELIPAIQVCPTPPRSRSSPSQRREALAAGDVGGRHQEPQHRRRFVKDLEANGGTPAPGRWRRPSSTPTPR
jgi:hypothetical protein